MSRSSTFSFDTWQGPARVPKGALLALLLLVAFEFGVARQNWMWDQVSGTPAGIIPALSERVISVNEPPRIIFMGSSRMRDAISCDLVTDELGLPAKSVINLSMDGGNPFDFCTIYERNREHLKGAAIIVIGLEDWFYNGGYPVGERARRFMNFDDRFGIFNTDQTRSLVAGHLWRTFDSRGPLSRLPRTLVEGPRKKLPWSEKERRIVWRKRTSGTGPKNVDADIERWGAFMYQRYEFKNGYERYIKKLTSLARADGSTVVHLQVPARRAHHDWVAQNFGLEYARYKKAALALDCDHRFFFESADAIGIPENFFYDYGHLADQGSEAFSRFFANKLSPLLK